MSQGNGGIKYDRNRAWCKSYRLRNQREKNKVVKLVRHLTKVNPFDVYALATLERLKLIVPVKGYDWGKKHG